MSSESDLSDYESDCLKEEEKEEEKNIPIVVKEIYAKDQGWKYLSQSNSYIFRGIDALIEIINHYNGNVDVFILHDSTIKEKTIFAAQIHRIKNLSIYAPIQIFPVYPDN